MCQPIHANRFLPRRSRSNLFWALAFLCRALGEQSHLHSFPLIFHKSLSRGESEGPTVRLPGSKDRRKKRENSRQKKAWRQRKYFIWDFITPGHLWVKISTDPAAKLSKQRDGSIGVFKVYTQQGSRLRAASPRVFFMNKPQLWRLIGKDAVSQFKPVSAEVPLTSIRLVNIITLGPRVLDVGGVSVSKSSVVRIPCLQNAAATVCLARAP